MMQLIDTSIWVDLLRVSTPKPLKEFAGDCILQRGTRLCEPIVFELTRYASDSEVTQFEQHLQTVPTLATPSDVWRTASELGRACRRQANLVKALDLDLLIAAVALHHDVEVVAFDMDYERIARVSPLKVRLLRRLVI